MVDLSIRHERSDESKEIDTLVREAFWDVYQPGCNEHYLAHCLRDSKVFIPELSFVAESGGRLVGMIYYAAAAVKQKDGSEFPVLTFGPLAVLPEHQKRGIGAALIEHSLELALESGHAAVVIYGNPGYYRRFGFESGERHGVSDGGGDFCDALQVLELRPGSMDGHSGCFHEGDVYHVEEETVAGFDQDFAPREKHALPSQIFLGMGKIKLTSESDFEDIYEIVNDAASAYKGVIPADRWHDPYMPREELRGQIDEGVVFHGYYVNGLLVGVMGIQDKGEVRLIRHAYVRGVCRKLGIGGKLLKHLHDLSDKPMLIGTWNDASWAVSFYEKHGFRRVADRDKKDALLRKYWNIPERQVETSVVLADDPVLYG